MPTVPSPPREHRRSTFERTPHVPRTPSAGLASSARHPINVPRSVWLCEDGLSGLDLSDWEAPVQAPSRPPPVPFNAAPVSLNHADRLTCARLSRPVLATRGDPPPADRARGAVAALTAPSAPDVQACLSYLVEHFDTAEVQAALDTVPPNSEAQSRLISTLISALEDMSEESPRDCEDPPMMALAVYLLEHCSWDAICEPRLFDPLQLSMRGPVTTAFIAAEARDAAAARAAAPEVFASAPDPGALVENILKLRRIKFWDSFLQMQSATILSDAIATGEFERVEQLLAFAPDSGAEAAARILFEAVGPGDAILPALRAFCAKHGLTMPQTLQPPPCPVTYDYMDALLQRVVERGLMPADLRHFWRVLKRCKPGLRERLLRSDLDNATGGEFTMLLRASSNTRVTGAFPPSLLGQLMQTYPERFECPLLGFGSEFAGDLVESLPCAQVDALVAMKAYIVVRNLLDMGQWTLLGKIMQNVSSPVRNQVIELLRKPAPPRDEQFASLSQPDSEGSDSASVATEDDDFERLSTIPGDPTAVPPPIAYI